MKKGILMGAALGTLFAASGTLTTTSAYAGEDTKVDVDADADEQEPKADADADTDEQEHKADTDAEKATDDADAAPTSADAASEKKISVGADLHVGLPVGNLADIGSLGFGPKLRGEYWLLPNLAVGLRLGFIYHLDKNNFGFSYIPIQFGGRYFFSEPRVGFYAGAELGPNFSSTRIEFAGVSRSTSGTDFGMELRGGYVISHELPVDISVNLTFIDLGQLGDTMVWGVEGGYTFAGF